MSNLAFDLPKRAGAVLAPNAKLRSLSDYVLQWLSPQRGSEALCYFVARAKHPLHSHMEQHLQLTAEGRQPGAPKSAAIKLMQSYPAFTVMVFDDDAPIARIAEALSSRAATASSWARMAVALHPACDDVDAYELQARLAIGSWAALVYRQVDVFCVQRPSPWQGLHAAATGAQLSMQLLHAPANQLSPIVFAELAVRLADAVGVAAEVIGENALERMRCDTLLALGDGSCSRPRMVVLRYGQQHGAPIALIGEGVTYDGAPAAAGRAGKGGAAVVLGAVLCAARAQLPVSVVAWLPLAENRVSGSALRPGDVHRAASGATLEVGHAGVAGLATVDALALAARESKCVLSVTASRTALDTVLGAEHAALFCSSDTLAAELLDAAARSGDAVCRLPLGTPPPSEPADMLHDCSRHPEHAAFLRALAGPQCEFAHLECGHALRRPNGRRRLTGYGVLLLVAWLQTRAKATTEGRH